MVQQKLNNRGVFTLRGFVIGMLVFSAMMAMGAILVRSAVTQHAVGDPSILDKYNRTAELEAQVSTVQGQVQNPDNTVIGFLTQSTRATLNTIGLGIGTLANIVNTLKDEVGIPPIILNLFITIMTISLLLAIVYATIRWYA